MKRKMEATSAIVVVEGDIDISQAGNFHALLLEKMGSAKRVTLQIRKMGQVDPAVLQVLISLKKTLTGQGRSLNFDPGGFPEQGNTLLIQLGYRQILFPSLPESHESSLQATRKTI
jgi:anti-anti-sigma regulatory factor